MGLDAEAFTALERIAHEPCPNRLLPVTGKSGPQGGSFAKLLAGYAKGCAKAADVEGGLPV
jgi:hypothetical protein